MGDVGCLLRASAHLVNIACRSIAKAKATLCLRNWRQQNHARLVRRADSPTPGSAPRANQRQPVALGSQRRNSFLWTGNLVRPRWIDDGPVDSPLMLGAFFGFIQKCSRKAMWTCLPLDIIFHREFTSSSTTCSIATFNGLLQPKNCKRPNCYLCREGLGGYDFRWTSDEWGWVYIQKFEEITGRHIRFPIWRLGRHAECKTTQ